MRNKINYKVLSDHDMLLKSFKESNEQCAQLMLDKLELENKISAYKRDMEKMNKACTSYEDLITKSLDSLSITQFALNKAKNLIDNLEQEYPEIAHKLMIVDDMIFIEDALKKLNT